MRRRVAVLTLALCGVAVTDTPAAVSFTQPRLPIALTSSGWVEIAIRVKVERHPDNRWLDVDIYQDEIRVGGWGTPIDGAEDAALFPAYRPNIQRLSVGRYLFTARACKGTKAEGQRTVCDRPRASAQMAFTVCGGDEEC